MLENTYFMIKPDGVARGLDQEIIKRVETAGLKIVEKKKLEITKELAEDIYSPHKGKPFYNGLLKFITSGPVIATVVQGDNAIQRLRDLMGATDPEEAAPGTIRGDLKEENIRTAEGTIKNLVHGSDSLESAKRESKIFFKGV